MNLYSYWANKNDLGTFGGSFDSSATANPSVNPGTGMAHVLGGVNLQGNPQYSLGNNGICVPTPYEYVTTTSQKVYMVKARACQIQFETPDSLVARGLDPNNPDHWVITSMLPRPGPFW